MTLSHDDDQGFVDELFPLDEEPGPAPRMAATSATALIDGALDAWQGAAAPPPDPGPGPSSPAGGLGAFGVGAAVLLAAVGVAATGHYLMPDEPDAVAVVDDGAPDLEAPEAPSPSVPEPVIEAAEVPAADPPALAQNAVAADDDDPPSPLTKARRRAARSAPDLLAQANELRRARNYRAAERTYLQVAARYGSSGSAYVARVAAASLRLEHLSNPRGAVALYREALRHRPGGNLDAEARYGLARAQRRLGQGAAERRTLEELLRRHPQAPFARRARSRLTELGAQ